MSDELKLQALGRIKAGERLADIAQDLGVPYPKLLSWRKELKEAELSGELHTLVDVDRLVVHEIAERTKRELAEIDPSGALVGEVDRVVDGVNGLQVLSAKLQAAGLKLAQKITNLSEVTDNARDINLLVQALAQLQTAFFAKGVTNNINVLQQNGVGGEGLSAFRSLLRD
jgi:hypothetical protein